MFEIEIKDKKVLVKSSDFIFRYPALDEHFFEVETDGFVQSFFIPASCDSIWEYDITLEQTGVAVDVYEGYVHLRLKYLSSLWTKTYHIEIHEEHLVFYYELEGEGNIDTLRYFEGILDENFTEHFYLTKHFNDHKLTDYCEYSRGSPTRFGIVFNPEANTYNKQYFEFYEYSQVSANSDLDYCGGNFVFNPGLLCFAMAVQRQARIWLSLGLVVEPGQYLFSEYEYIGGAEFGLNVNYWGGYEVKEKFCTPKLIFHVATSEYEALQKYVHYLTRTNVIPEVKREVASWWYGPIVCGWGHQCYQGDIFRVRSPSERKRDSAAYFMSNQANYEAMVAQLMAYGLDWRVLIIDARWTINAGMKTIDKGRWPDMRGFVEALHEQGKKVLIWWGPWDVEGWSEDECIRYAGVACGNRRNRLGRFKKFGEVRDGMKLAPDTTLSAVRDKIAAQIEYLLAPSGINLDGFKIDHVAATPGLYGMQFPQGSKRLYGIELLHDYHQLVYATAKRIKPDALIIGQSPNPYFSDCIDMIRLGDIYSHNQISVVSEMDFRLKMAQIANPSWLIDMDGWPMPSLEAFREYVRFQILKGVPSLYYVSHLDTTGEAISESDFALIRQLWQRYIETTLKN